MPEPPEDELRGIGDPRPLPHGLRARLEDALLGRADARPLPDDVRARLDDALTEDVTAQTLRDVDAPRPLPAHVRAHLEDAMEAASGLPGLPERRARRERRMAVRWQPIAAVAAAVLLLAGGLLASRLAPGSSGKLEAGRPRAGSAPSSTAANGESFGAAAAPNAAGPTSAAARQQAASGDAASSASARGSGGGATGPAAATSGPPPPFMSTQATAAAVAGAPVAGAAPPAPTTTPAAGAPVRIGLLGGDAAAEAGFRAYVALVNQQGGIDGHRLELVARTPGTGAPGTIATVNLSTAAVASASGAPAWVTTPLLETLPVTEDVLHDRVFDFSSPIERQAHLAADSVFPAASPGSTAVIYRAPSGPFADRVPAALQTVLQSRGVVVTTVTVNPGHTPPFVTADAAFLSLDTADADTWLRAARAAGYSPRLGLAGIYSLFDEALLPDLPAGTRVLSPYSLGDNATEVQALRSGTNRPLGASSIHGWATAKMLAVALWQSGATTSDQLTAALRALTGYSNNFAPPYGVRAGTNSRTPEAVLLQPAQGAFVAKSDFERDPR